MQRLLLTGALALAPGCVIAGTRGHAPEPARETDSVALLADSLVDLAGARLDLNTARIHVPAFRTRAAAALAMSDDELAAGEDLAYLWSLALSRRVHTLDFETVHARQASHASSEPWRASVELGATHVLLGEFHRIGYYLEVRTRLVDPETFVIVATAEGHVPIAELRGFEVPGSSTTRRSVAAPADAAAPREELLAREERLTRSGDPAAAGGATDPPAVRLAPGVPLPHERDDREGPNAHLRGLAPGTVVHCEDLGAGPDPWHVEGDAPRVEGPALLRRMRVERIRN